MKEINYNDLIAIIHSNLTGDLLKGRWTKQEHFLEGHCYVGAEALYHLIDKDNYNVYYAVYTDEGGRATHWWLENKYTKNILDATKEQYTYFGLVPPYHLKKRGSFLTKNPSKRAMKVINKVNDYMSKNNLAVKYEK